MVIYLSQFSAIKQLYPDWIGTNPEAILAMSPSTACTIRPFSVEVFSINVLHQNCDLPPPRFNTNHRRP